MGQHRHHNDQKHDGRQPLCVRVARGHQCGPKNAGRRRRHNAARRNPGQQHTLLRQHGRADGGQPHRHRANHQQQYQHEQADTPIDLRQLRDVQLRGNHDEQHRQQDHGQVFLKAPQRFALDQLHVADHQSHQRDAEQSGLVLNAVAGPVHHQHQHHQEGCLEVRRYGTAPVHPASGPTAQTAQHGRGCNGAAHAQGDLRPATVRQREILKRQHRQKHTDRVVDDAFPLEQCCRVFVQPRLAQQRQDDCGPGDHQDGAQHPRHGPAEPCHVVRSQAAEQPRQRRRQQRQPPYAVLFALELAGLEVHAALKQNDRHAQPDHFGQLYRRQAERNRAGQRPQYQAHRNQHHDGGQADPRREPLAGQTRSQNQQKNRGHVHARTFRKREKSASAQGAPASKRHDSSASRYRPGRRTRLLQAGVCTPRAAPRQSRRRARNCPPAEPATYPTGTTHDRGPPRSLRCGRTA